VIPRRPRRGGGPGAAGRRRRILAVVRRVPRGRVATYGQVATLAGLPGHAREVGRCLAGLPEGSTVPWQRVINARGEVSSRGLWGDDQRQRALLESEGVVFDRRGRVDLERHGWEPRPLGGPRAERRVGRSGRSRR
jgi:methylated-DNA-protein-cysteine methyltransferase-like protein